MPRDGLRAAAMAPRSESGWHDICSPRDGTRDRRSTVNVDVFAGPATRAALVRPRDPGESGLEDLVDWLRSERDAVARTLSDVGAVRLRGFQIRSAEEFERVAFALDPELRSGYLGTSPRHGRTKFVFTASELPAPYPVPQHLEMSFLPDPPRKLLFFCPQPSARGGETPLTDFRRVWDDLGEDVRRTFEERGLRYVRNYDGPRSSRVASPWKLKRWDEMFLTTDRAKIEATCAAQGLRAEWLAGDRLRLVNTAPASRVHPETGRRAWFNHLQVFHAIAAAEEFERIRRFRGGLTTTLLSGVTSALTSINRRRTAPDDLPMHATFADGGEIPDALVRRVVDAIWARIGTDEWEAGDVVIIDNWAVAHGRLPYRGAREVLVAWTSGYGAAATVASAA